MKRKPRKTNLPAVKSGPHKQRYPVSARSTNGMMGKVNLSMPNIFHNNGISSTYATRDGRVHCVAVQRTAIYKDAYGNKVVLKENQQTMNVPENTRGISFHSGGKNWKKY